MSVVDCSRAEVVECSGLKPIDPVMEADANETSSELGSAFGRTLVGCPS